VIIFGSVRFLSKKATKPIFFLKKTETGSNRPVSVFLGKNRFGSVFQFWLGFFRFWFGFLGFGSVFPGLAWFFRFFPVFFGFGSVFLVFCL
jgi:hypothetical protein